MARQSRTSRFLDGRRPCICRISILLLLFLPGWTEGLAQGVDVDEPWWAPLDTLPPGINVLRVDSLYEIEGGSAELLRAQMQLRGPVGVDGKQYFGLHNARWRYTYQSTADSAGRCRLETLKVLVRSVVTLPHVRNEDAIPEPVRGSWDAYLSALREHEEGHREVSLEAVQWLRDQAKMLLVPDCGEMRQAMADVAGVTRTRMKEGQRAYDERTNHGRVQGAVWPPRRVPRQEGTSPESVGPKSIDSSQEGEG